MTKPPTMPEAEARGLLAKYKEGVYTFSNGDEWYSWADSNCYECAHYAKDHAGLFCAFEGAAFLSMVSPELARMFGWIESTDYPGDFDAPQECAFLKRKDDRDDDRPSTPAPDPTQLVLIADPTEDIARIKVIDVPQPVSV